MKIFGIVALLYLLGTTFSLADEVDSMLLEVFFGPVPAGLEVEVKQKSGSPVFLLSISDIEVTTSIFGQSLPVVRNGKVDVNILLIPNYSSKTIGILKKKNKDLKNTIQLPNFRNGKHCFYLYPPVTVPNNTKDSDKLVAYFVRMMKGWEYIGDDEELKGKSIENVARYFLTTKWSDRK